MFSTGTNEDFKDFLGDVNNEENNSGDNEEDKSKSTKKPTDNNIFSRFIDMVDRVLDVFEKQPVTESSEERQIEKKYPKFLSKYKLINLQFNDFHFRETFMIQILILFQSLKQPINIIQTKYFKILNKKAVSRTKSRIYRILTNEAELDAHNKKVKSEEDKDSEPSHLPSNNLTCKFIISLRVKFSKF